jgi:hypothetical protein
MYALVHTVIFLLSFLGTYSSVNVFGLGDVSVSVYSEASCGGEVLDTINSEITEIFPCV